MLASAILKEIQSSGLAKFNLPFNEVDLLRAVQTAVKEGYVKPVVDRDIIAVAFGATTTFTQTPRPGRVLKIIGGENIRASTHDANITVTAVIDNKSIDPLFSGLQHDADIWIPSEGIPFIFNQIQHSVTNNGIFPSVDITFDIDYLDIDDGFYDTFFGPLFEFDFAALQAFVSEFAARR